MYTILTAQVTDQTLQLTNEPKLASGGVNEIRVEVTFCPLWDGMAKTAVFYRKPEEVYHVLLQDGAGTVPQEVAATEGPVFFGVFGVSGDTVRTSEVRTLVFEQGAITTGTNAPEPTPDVYQQILTAAAAHAENKNNPHGVTLAQIGAAPAGYGLGEYATSISYKSLESVFKSGKSGLYRGQVITELTELGNQWVWLDIRIESATYGIAYGCTYGGNKFIVRFASGVVQPLEWVNPPMTIGVEYRTTDRFGDFAVYTQLISCGTLATGRNVIAHNLGAEIIRYCGSCNKDALPYLDPDYNGEMKLAVSTNNIIINATSGFAGRKAYVQLWYVKG